MDTSLYRTLYEVPKVSTLEGFHCTWLHENKVIFTLMQPNIASSPHFANNVVPSCKNLNGVQGGGGGGDKSMASVDLMRMLVIQMSVRLLAISIFLVATQPQNSHVVRPLNHEALMWLNYPSVEPLMVMYIHVAMCTTGMALPHLPVYN